MYRVKLLCEPTAMRLLPFVAATTLIVTSTGFADEPGKGENTQLENWIEMLDSRKYRDRTEATAKLQRSGSAAIEALGRVVIDGSSEASDRALGILEFHYAGDDEILKQQSKEVLKEIAEQSEHAESIAAQRILKPAEPDAPKRLFPNMQVPNLRLPNLPNLALQNRAPINRRTRVRISVADGSKDVTVEENGKSIRVIENADGIQVEKKVENGKTVKTKYKDAAELKEKDPDAHKAYQKAIAGGPAPIQLQINGNLIQPGQLQAAPQFPRQLEQMQKRIDELRKRNAELREKQLKQHKEMLERIRKQQAVPPSFPPRPKRIETEISEPLEV